MDRGAWRAVVHGVTKESDTTQRLTHPCVVVGSGAGSKHLALILVLKPGSTLASRTGRPAGPRV